jgi:hypothetical protein
MGAYDDGGMTKAVNAARAAGIPTQSAGTPFGQAGSASPTKVTVERGDTLTSIAKENNTTVKAILAANPKFTEDPKYKGGNLIFSGTTVKIPQSVSNTPSTAVKTPVAEPKVTSSTSEPKITASTSTASTSTVTSSTSISETTSSTTETTQTDNSVVTSTISATPLTPATITTASVAASLPPPPPVKTASIDTVLFNDEELPIEIMTDLIFENIGGQELINIARNDIVNGQQVSYQPIKNLSSIQQQYNPNNILSLQSTSDKYFANFPIKLESKIPTIGTGPGGSPVYIDPSTGDIIVEVINTGQDEQVEIQITVSGTIYETEFGEIIS